MNFDNMGESRMEALRVFFIVPYKQDALMLMILIISSLQSMM